MSQRVAATGRDGDMRTPERRQKLKNIEAILPLLPMQQALLFHSLGATDDPGLLQVHFTLEGEFDPQAFTRAWRTVVARHAALRMSLRAVDHQPHRFVIWRSVDVPITFADWRDVGIRERDAKLAEFCLQDRRTGLDLGTAPVMRLAVFRLAECDVAVVWTCHHLFLDGWSTAAVIREALLMQRAYQHGEMPPAARVECSYRDYHAWLKQQDRRAAESYWRHQLRGFRGMKRITTGYGSAESSAHEPPSPSGIAELELEQGTVAVLSRTAAQYQLTSNAAIQGGWSLLLGSWCQSDDIVFGTVVSGRSGDLSGVEATVGFLANVVPVRIHLDPRQSLVRWLQGLRDNQFEMQAFETLPLADIQGCREVSGNQPLFESLLVVENFPLTDDRVRRDDLQLRDYRSGITSRYPLTLAVVPGNTWSLTCHYRKDRFEASFIEGLLDGLQRLLQQIATRPEQTLAECLTATGLSPLAAASPRPEIEAGSVTDSREGTATPDETSIPPRTAQELALAQIWEEALNVRHIGMQDDFFALGGTSLAAVRIFGQIEARLQAKLPVSALLMNPTIEKLARLIRPEESVSHWSCLVPIQHGGQRIPLFCVHAGGGHVLFYRDLARHLGSDQPVYGLEPLGLDGSQPPLESFEDMATLYIREMQTVQPRGPYLLAGYCLGGTVCCEIARQLDDLGEQVSLLAILDTGPPTHHLGTASESAYYKVGKIVRLFGWRGVTNIIRYVGRRALLTTRQFVALHFGRGHAQQQVYLEIVEEACRKAFKAYGLKPCNVPITLIRSTESEAEAAREFHWDWAHYTPRLDHHVLDVGHLTMLAEPDVLQVAALIKECLDGIADGDDPHPSC